MDFLTPPMYDVFNIDMLKYKMSMYLKTLGMYVFLATTKKSYLGNNKHIEANAQALEVLRSTLSKDFLSMVLIVIPLLQCGTPCPLQSFKRQTLWRRNLVRMNPNNIATWSRE